MEYAELKEAGKILAESVDYARTIVKKGKKLIEIAEDIEKFIRKKGAEPAFPVNLSINEIAAHATPSFNDDSVAHGLLKVDIGVHIDGWTADTAFSVDLENDEDNRNLIEAAEEGLKVALDKVKLGIGTDELGYAIEKKIVEKGVMPIRNLTGHSIEQWEVHAGISVPNFGGGSRVVLGEGVYAIEPFTTFGAGMVRDGKLSGIYHLASEGNVRDSFARKVLNFIAEKYRQLPFCSRWIYNEFGSRGLLALRLIEQAGLLYQYPQLVEASGAVVAQAEHTIILGKKVEIITA